MALGGAPPGAVPPAMAGMQMGMPAMGMSMGMPMGMPMANMSMGMNPMALMSQQTQQFRQAQPEAQQSQPSNPVPKREPAPWLGTRVQSSTAEEKRGESPIPREEAPAKGAADTTPPDRTDRDS